MGEAKPSKNYDLIVTILSQSLLPKILTALQASGERAITAFRGRGRDLLNPAKFLGIPIEPEREILFLVTDHERSDAIVDIIRNTGELSKPDRGLVFVVDLRRVEGLTFHGLESLEL